MFVGRESELGELRRYFAEGGRIASICGARGSGKTSLAYAFEQSARDTDLITGVVKHVHCHPNCETIEGINSIQDGRSLWIIDDFDQASTEQELYITGNLRRDPNARFIFCSKNHTDVLRRVEPELLTIELGGLSRSEFSQLLRANIDASDLDNRVVGELFDLVEGHPLFSDLASASIRDLMITLEQFVRGICDFQHTGLVDIEGRPLNKILDPIQIDVRDTNTHLLKQIESDPNSIYRLTPRQFEEVVAELLSRRGFEVELTPASGDGGFDIYAARSDAIGRFLFLIECKRYTPPTKVGVAVVRSLHGVVQQKQANAGVVVTSSFFTRGAKEFQESVPYQMQLKDYVALQKWLGVL